MSTQPNFVLLHGDSQDPTDDTVLPQELIDDIRRFDRERSKKLGWHVSDNKLHKIIDYLYQTPNITTHDVTKAHPNICPRIIHLTLRKAWAEGYLVRARYAPPGTTRYIFHWAHPSFLHTALPIWRATWF